MMAQDFCSGAGHREGGREVAEMAVLREVPRGDGTAGDLTSR